MNTKESEFATLKVAFLLTALDGNIDESERSMFNQLVERCHEVDVQESKLVLASVDLATKRMLKVSRDPGKAIRVTRPEERVLEMFMEEVELICDWSDFVRDSARVRRAFVMWTAMIMADNDRSEIELKAMARLQNMVNSFKLIGNDFLKSVKDEVAKINKASAKLETAPDLETDKKLHDDIDASFNNLAEMIHG